MLEANFLTILLKDNYAKPIDTTEDILDRGLKLLFFPYSHAIPDLVVKNLDTVEFRFHWKTSEELFSFVSGHLFDL